MGKTVVKKRSVWQANTVVDATESLDWEYVVAVMHIRDDGSLSTSDEKSDLGEYAKFVRADGLLKAVANTEAEVMTWEDADRYVVRAFDQWWRPVDHEGKGG